MDTYTKFIQKALELSEKLRPEVRSKEKRLSMISGEKESTVKNWLFHNKTPVPSKRLMLSDRFGVSENSLFGEGFSFNIPVSVYNNELDCYMIPQIEECNLEKVLSGEVPLIAIDRIPLKLNKLFCYETVELHRTYCIKVVKLCYPPFVSPNDMIFLNPSAPYKSNIFCVFKTSTSAEIVRVQNESNKHVMYDKSGRVLKQRESDLIIPILFILSGSYQHEL